MHLSRLTLDLRNSQARRDLADAYDMHRSLVRAFVIDEHTPPPRFLWRLEPESVWREPVVIVQSEHEPDWSTWATRGYLKNQPESKSVDLDELLTKDARYRFRLFANPTVTQAGKRLGLASEQTQCEWLDRQATKAGFDVATALVTATHVMDIHGGNIRLRQACFEGVLRVDDTGLLATAIAQGIGPGKAFGLGLLSLAPQ